MGTRRTFPVVLEFLQVFDLHEARKSIIFCWTPRHTDLPVNDAADAAAKETALLWNLISDPEVGTDVRAFLLAIIS
jgi:hypothetical protein